jgi:hypothetical protein
MAIYLHSGLTTQKVPTPSTTGSGSLRIRQQGVMFLTTKERTRNNPVTPMNGISALQIIFLQKKQENNL